MNVNAVAGLSAALAAILVAAGTRPPGPALYGDSAGYLGTAVSLARHGTLRVPYASYASADSTAPLAQWPPGFPALLAVPLRFGASEATSARIVNIVSAAATIGLVVLIVGAAAGPGWATLGAVAVIVTTSVVWIHLEVLSEPPFTALTMLTLALMVRAPAPERPAATGLASAACVLVRYAGLGVVGAVVLWEALQPGPVVARLRRAAVAGTPGVAAYLVWTAVVRHGGAAVRHVHLDHHPLLAARRALGSTFAWLAPGFVGEDHHVELARVALKAALLIGLAALVVALGRRPARGRPSPSLSVASAATLLATSIVALMLFARVMESGVSFYDRVLAPAHALLDVAIVAALASWWSDATRPARAVAMMAVGAWLAWSMALSVRMAHEITTHGIDHTVVGASPSPLWAWVGDAGRAGPIYSNDPADVYFETHRASRYLPWVMTPDSARALCQALARRPGLVVWVSAYTGEGLVYPELVPRLTTPATLTRAVPLHPVARFPDGIVWAPDSSLAGDPRCVS
ncbi:MAG TPA: hypothetical protein VNW46_02155 [Gemmatimonadaceae bacterium]|nr:hypothetical protein [Gemmatimonadaceae bacterium]